MENKEKDPNRKTNKNLPLIIVGVVLLIVVVIIIIAMQKKGDETIGGRQTGTQSDAPALIDEDGEPIPEASVSFDDDDLLEVKVPNVGTAKVVVPGTNPITADNVVVTEDGTVAENAGMVMGENSPKQTGFLNKEELPDNIVKLNVGAGGFSPNSFTTTVGAPTTFSLTGVDEFSHMISFDDPSLGAIGVLVGPGQTKAITFNAPTTAGTYTFYCSSPGHRDQGEEGKMIVR
jgi:plastocyanin